MRAKTPLRRKALLWAVSAGVLATCAGMVACAPQASSQQESSSADQAQEEAIGPLYSFRPSVVDLDNGSQAQRTPSDEASYNIDVLNADERGCSACHEDLTKAHTDVYPITGTPDMTALTVDGCIMCHTDYTSHSQITNLGTLVHAVHADVEAADCWTCHDATNDGEGMELWDQVKYDRLKGITQLSDLSSLNPSLEYSQDKTFDASEYFALGSFWTADPAAVVGIDSSLEGEELDAAMQKVWDKWTITVKGAGVGNEVTWTLNELIEKFESEKVVVKDHCAENPLGGGLITAYEITGIPVAQLFEAAEVASMDVDYVIFDNATGMSAPVRPERIGDMWLAYEINGEKLTLEQGYPIKLMGDGLAGPALTKVSTGFTFVKDGSSPFFEIKEGHVNAVYPENGAFYNKPNVGIFEVQEGQIIKTDEEFTIEGYADAWNNEVTAIDVSFDNGTTWTTYPVENTTTYTWVTWKFKFTPAEDGAYVFCVRAHDAAGNVTSGTPYGVRVLVNAQS